MADTHECDQEMEHHFVRNRFVPIRRVSFSNIYSSIRYLLCVCSLFIRSLLLSLRLFAFSFPFKCCTITF